MRTLNPIIALIILLSVSGSVFGQASESGVSPSEKTDISKSISLYPNPASDFISVKLGVLRSNHTKLSLHNILGSEINVESEVIDDHEVRIRVKDLPTGYYLLAVRDEQSQFKGTYKFLKR